ncbi:zinc finger domain-containing protein [Nocardia wallacei]|uniref:zinc finger domain-containing protein n=1 Tax=Nocardia wallacei TaxID=480035 RepID=UPI0024556724|nr:hypothetical protein [Nocardia wallacei]
MPDYIPLPRPRLGQTQAAERTHAIATVACPYEPCQAPVGEPCTFAVADGTRYESTNVHPARARAARDTVEEKP